MPNRFVGYLLGLLPCRLITDPKTGLFYVARYTLLAFFGRRIYLHHLFRGDRRPHLHDHPWGYISIVLRGAYIDDHETRARLRRGPGSVIYRHAGEFHRVTHVTSPGQRGCWTLVIAGKRVRDWGFLTEGGLIHHTFYHHLYENDRV